MPITANTFKKQGIGLSSHSSASGCLVSDIWTNVSSHVCRWCRALRTILQSCLKPVSDAGDRLVDAISGGNFLISGDLWSVFVCNSVSSREHLVPALSAPIPVFMSFGVFIVGKLSFLFDALFLSLCMPYCLTLWVNLSRMYARSLCYAFVCPQNDKLSYCQVM